MNKGFRYIFISAVLLGTFGVFITHLAGYFSVYEQIVLRSVVALVCCLAVALYYKESFRTDYDRTSRIWFAFFLIAFPLSIICFTQSVVMSNATVSIFLLYAGSLVATFVSGKLFFAEQKSVIDWISLVVCLIGIVIFAQLRDSSTNFIVLLPGLCAGLLEGMVHSARRGIGGGLARSVLLSYQHASTVVIGVVAGLLTHSLHSDVFSNGVPLSIWGYGVGFGVLLCVMSWTLLQGFRHYDVNKGTVLLSSELLFATIFNFLLLSVIPNSYELAGGVLIGVASVLPVMFNNRKDREK